MTLLIKRNMRAVPLLLLFLSPALGGPPDPVKGEWKCLGFHVDGKAASATFRGHLRLTVDGKTLRQHLPALDKELARMAYKIVSPGVLELRQEGAVFLGRFEVKKDGKLFLAWPGPVVDGVATPPKDFTPRDGVNVSSWERAK